MLTLKIILDKILNENNGILRLKVKAGAKHNQLQDFIVIDGHKYLKVTIKSIPEDGKANKAIIDFFAQKFHIPKKSIEIIAGHRNNLKVLKFSTVF